MCKILLLMFSLYYTGTLKKTNIKRIIYKREKKNEQTRKRQNIVKHLE